MFPSYISEQRQPVPRVGVGTERGVLCSSILVEHCQADKLPEDFQPVAYWRKRATEMRQLAEYVTS
jgi:hypothetical protein